MKKSIAIVIKAAFGPALHSLAVPAGFERHHCPYFSEIWNDAYAKSQSGWKVGD